MHHGRRGWQTVVVVQQADGTWRRTEARLEEKWDDTHFLCFCIPKQILNGRVKITWECMHMQTHAHAHVSICGDVHACLAQTSTDAHVYVVDTPQHTSPLRNTHTHTHRVTDMQEGQQGSLEICSSANNLLAKHCRHFFIHSLCLSVSPSRSPSPLNLCLSFTPFFLLDLILKFIQFLAFLKVTLGGTVSS